MASGFCLTQRWFNSLNVPKTYVLKLLYPAERMVNRVVLYLSSKTLIIY
jgi:hypothetical protein